MWTILNFLWICSHWLKISLMENLFSTVLEVNTFYKSFQNILCFYLYLFQHFETSFLSSSFYETSECVKLSKTVFIWFVEKTTLHVVFKVILINRKSEDSHKPTGRKLLTSSVSIIGNKSTDKSTWQQFQTERQKVNHKAWEKIVTCCFTFFA